MSGGGWGQITPCAIHALLCLSRLRLRECGNSSILTREAASGRTVRNSSHPKHTKPQIRALLCRSLLLVTRIYFASASSGFSQELLECSHVCPLSCCFALPSFPQRRPRNLPLRPRPLHQRRRRITRRPLS